MIWKATPRWVRFLVRVPSAKKSWSRAYGYLPLWGNMSRPAVGQQATAVLDAICEPIAQWAMPIALGRFTTGDKKSGTHKGVPLSLVNAISEFSNTV